MTALNVFNLAVFLVLAVAAVLVYRHLRRQVDDAEGFMGVRDESELAATSAAQGDSGDQGDLVAVVGDQGPAAK